MQVAFSNIFSKIGIGKVARERKLDKIEAKANDLVTKIENGDVINKKDKLTKKEWSILSRSDRATAQEAKKQIYKLWYDKINETGAIKSGDIGTIAPEGKYGIKYHSEKLYLRGKKKKPHVSHAVQSFPDGIGYSNAKVGLFVYPHTSIWRLQVPKLLNTKSNGYQLLLEKYGSKEELDETIQKKYEKIERALHSKPKRHPTGKPDEEAFTGKEFGTPKITFSAVGKLLKAAITRDHTKSKEKAEEHDFHAIHARFFEGSKEDVEGWETSCAAFTSKATIATLIELDKQLNQEMQDYLKKLDNKDSKRKAKQLKTAQKNKELVFIKIPFKKSEKLKHINTSRMLRLLRKKECVVKVEPDAMKAFYKSLFR